MNMRQLTLLAALCSGFFSLTHTETVDPSNRPKPNKPLSKYQTFKRTFFDFIGLEKLSYKAVAPETETYVRGLIKEMGMENYNIEIRSMSNAAKRLLGRMNAFVVPALCFPKSELNFLFISEDWFNSLPTEEKRALIGHELTHIKNNHAQKRMVVSLISAVLCYNILNGKITEKLNQRPDASILITLPTISINEPTSSTETAKELTKVETATQKDLKPILNLFIAGYISTLVRTAINSWYSRITEKEADIEGAKALNCADGGAELWQRYIDATEDPESRFILKRVFNKIKKVVTYPTRKIAYFLYASHPEMKARRDYLKKLAQEQAIENSVIAH